MKRFLAVGILACFAMSCATHTTVRRHHQKHRFSTPTPTPMPTLTPAPIIYQAPTPTPTPKKYPYFQPIDEG